MPNLCSRMPRTLSLLCSLLFLLFTSAKAQSDSAPVGIEWHKGPYTASLGGIATIFIPEGYKFADAAGTKRVLELTQNPVSGQEVGVIMPARQTESSDGTWFMLFDFHEVGYITDDDQESLNSSSILESIKKGTEKANVVRKEKGWTPFHVQGWSSEPHYDPSTHNLTWAVLGQEETNEGGITVNHSVRLLGRRGTMSVDLVLSPDQLPSVLPLFNGLLQSFSYSSGNRYVDFVKGDKNAGYGLTALIAGGVAATAVKTGLLATVYKFIVAAVASLWKLIVLAFATVISSFRKLFRRKSGGHERRLQAPQESPDTKV